ncbi:MAG: hypothetical protein HY601_02615 [Candidatus Omnitrophica bacterium]|nr:hypothetical protein [Candidatus Omnitrophota bacterium]
MGLWLIWFLICAASPALASEPIDTAFLQGAWPKQRVRTLEIGRYPARWRQQASRADGVFAGLEFEAPCPRQELWSRTTDYADLRDDVPGVLKVEVTPQGPGRWEVTVQMQVLWKTFRLRFEVEEARLAGQDEVRFRLSHPVIGEYRGVCWLRDAAGSGRTAVGLATWLQPARPVPVRLILLVERMALLRGMRNFLESLERTCYTTRP